MAIQLIIDNPGIGEFTLVSTTAGATADPGAGNWQVTAAGDRIDVSHTAGNGLAVDGPLSNLAVNAYLYFWVNGESRTYQITSTSSNAGWHTFGVDPLNIDDSTSFSLNLGDAHSLAFYNPASDGVPGPQGPVGPEGPQGATGDPGPTGAAGADGTDGADGSDGLTAYEIWLLEGNAGTEQDFLDSLVGAQGPIGPQGPEGPQGPTGATGATGPAGANGVDGTDGLTAYEIWLLEGNVGTEQDFLDSLVGEQGPIGPEGPEGPEGPIGPEGPGSEITVEDDGVVLSTNVKKLNFAGALTLAEPVADEITVTATPGAAPVASVFTRTGAVIAQAGDYSATQIDNDSSNVTGATVAAALDSLDNLIDTHTHPQSEIVGLTTTLAGKSDVGHTHPVGEVTGLSAAATTAIGTSVGELVGVIDVDGQPGLGTLDGTNLTNTSLNTGSGIGTWQWQGGTLSGPPTQGQFYTNASIPTGTDTIRIHYSGQRAGSYALMRDLNIGDRLFFSCPSSTVGSEFCFKVRDTYSDASGSWFDIPVDIDAVNTSIFEPEKYYSISLVRRESAGTGGSIGVEDEGVEVVADASALNFVGAGVTAADAGNGKVNVTIAPGAAPIDTVFGRTGTVVALFGDYNASLINDDSTINAASVAAALSSLDTLVTALDTDKAEVTDPRFPTTAENAALAGTPGAGPSGVNPYVLSDDVRMTDARNPLAHDHVVSDITPVPEARIVGRALGAGTGDAQELTAAQARSVLNVIDANLAATKAEVTAHATSDGTSHSQVVTNQTDIQTLQTQIASVPVTTVGPTPPVSPSFGHIWIETP